MRNISTATLAKLTSQYGVIPSNIIEIEWAIGNRILYGDKRIPTENVQGRIITLANLEDVVNLSKNGTSQSINVVLEDYDGALKTIFNNVDIHKKKVWVYQWFEDIPLSEKFLIFTGQIVSPVIWKEGERTLSITVISDIEEEEVGFSPEEGQFTTLPPSLVGTAWPLCFGQCLKVPAILIDDIAHGAVNNSNSSSTRNGAKNGSATTSVTTDGTGIADPSLPKQIQDNDLQSANSAELAILYFVGYIQASLTARKLGELDDLDPIKSGKGRFSSLAQQYLDLGNKSLQDASKINQKNETLKSTQGRQKSLEKSSIGITNGGSFPNGTQQSVSLNLNGAIHTGTLSGLGFAITSRQHPSAEKYQSMTVDSIADRTGDPVIDRDVFFYADAGIPVRINVVPPVIDSTIPDGQGGVTTVTLPAQTNAKDTDIHPIRYVVAATLQVEVQAVFCYQNDSLGNRYLIQLPRNYYQVYQVNFGTLPVTLLYFAQPLSSIGTPNGQSAGFEDAIWVNTFSSVGPNTVDILRWLITTYTSASIDEASFSAVSAIISSYPSSFAVLDRPKILDLLSQIAYQARCLIFLKNGIFYLKYLSRKESPVDTITEEDIIEQTIEVTYTETEEIITKSTAEWKYDYEQQTNNLIIQKYNTLYYGTQEKRYNYFIYNLQQLVEKSSTFWLIRTANTFKKITFKTPMHKLKIETLDTITLNFNSKIVSNGPIDCVVEEANFDSSDFTINFTCWVPVRAGEMEEYPFAFPADLSTEFVFPTPSDVIQGRVPGNNGTGKPGTTVNRISGSMAPSNNHVTIPASGTTPHKNLEQPFTGDPGTGGTLPIHRDTPRAWGTDPSYLGDLSTINAVIPQILQRLDLSNNKALGRKPQGTTDYQYDKSTAKKNTFTNPPPRTAPGFIVSGTGTNYVVKIYFEGLSNDSTTVFNVKLIKELDGGKTLDPGTAVIVSEVLIGSESGVAAEYYIQPSGIGSAPRTAPGLIVEGSGNTYTVETFFKGMDEESTILTSVDIIKIAEGEVLDAGTPVIVSEVIFNKNDSTITEYYIQPTLWS